MAIFVGIMGVLMVSFLISKSSYLSADASIRVQEQVRRAYDAMVKELREAGNVNGPNGRTASNLTRLDFQIARSYDTGTCNGICWGSETATGQWVHYLVNSSKLYRCQSAGQSDAIADFSACRVLATDVQNFSADYDDSDRTATLRLETKITSTQLAGGSLGVTPAPLIASIKLRNDS